MHEIELYESIKVITYFVLKVFYLKATHTK